MTILNSLRGYAACAAVTLIIFSGICYAGNRSQRATLSSADNIDSSTHLRTYSYTLENPEGNVAVLDTLVIKLDPGVDVVTDIRSPPGWRAFYSNEQGAVMWAAVGYRDPQADDPSGNVSPSDYAVRVGTSLAGFSFKSFSPPGVGLAITQSFAPLYTAANEDEIEALETDKSLSTLPEDNGYQISTVVPVPAADWTGNRRPAVDGFLVFANVEGKTEFKGSALVVLRLGSAGESVDASTLRILLNGADVTSMFVWSSQYNGYAAIFAPGGAPIQTGSNVLRTSVEGIVPGTDRRATDTDRLAFEFSP